MKQVTANVYVETGLRGCNLGVVTTSEGVVMVDAPMRPTDAVAWCNQISGWGEVRYLINTEQHRDHTLGDFFIPGILVSHEKVRETLLTRNVDEAVQQMKRIDPEGSSLLEGYQVRLPDITFTDSVNLHLGNHTFELISLPGHASGVIGIYVPEERVIFVSDCVFYQKKSFLHEAMPDQWLESLKRVSEIDADIIVPGHGDDVCGKEYLNEQANIIERWVEVVRTAIRQGLSEENALATIRCPDPYPIAKPGPMSEAELDRKIIARLYRVLV